MCASVFKLLLLENSPQINAYQFVLKNKRCPAELSEGLIFVSASVFKILLLENSPQINAYKFVLKNKDCPAELSKYIIRSLMFSSKERYS